MFIWTLEDIIFVIIIGVFILWFIIIELLYLIATIKEKIEKKRNKKTGRK